MNPVLWCCRVVGAFALATVWRLCCRPIPVKIGFMNDNHKHQHSTSTTFNHNTSRAITTNIMLRAVKQLRLLLGILLMALPCLSSKASFNIQGRVYPVYVQNDQDKNELSSMNRRKRKMTDVTVPSPTSKALCFRGGSLTVEEETDTKSILTKVRNVIRSLLHMGGKKSPLVTQLFKSVIGWVEYLIGTPLLPLPKSSSKQKISKRGRHEKKQKTKSQSHSTVQEDTIKSSKPRKGSLDSLNKNRVHVPKKGQEKVQTGEKRTRLDPINKGNSNNKRSNTGHSHLNTNIKSTNSNYRIQRELKEFLSSPPPNLAVKVGKNIRLWIITMTGAKNSIYEGETYRLRVQFPPEYPTVPPSVYFLQPTPRHEHVYTNGDICLSLLGKDWRPTMTAQSIAMSILSILSGAQRKSLPMDNARHAQNQPGQRQDNWVYHDDNC